MEQHAAQEIPIIILGAGPGGFQLGVELKRYNIPFLILDKGDVPGYFFKQYPKHRTLISINRPYPGHNHMGAVALRYDWNSLIGDGVRRFTDYSKDYFPHADRMLDYMLDLQKDAMLNIQFNTEITNVQKEGEKYALTTSTGAKFLCKYLIIATGWNLENVHPACIGVEGVQTYGNHDLDRKRYENKSVLIIGKGNSAFETADYLIPAAGNIHVVSSAPIKLSHYTRYVGSVRAVNNNFLDTYLLKAGNNILTMNIYDINKVGDHFEVHMNFKCIKNKRSSVVSYDEIISCTGFKFDDSFLSDELKPKFCSKRKFPLMKGNWEHETAPNIFYAGTITHILDVYSAASGFIHGFRYNSVILGKYLAFREGIALPHIEFDSLDQVSSKMIDRVNNESGIFLQQNFVCDVFVPKENGKFHYYENLTLRMATEHVFNEFDHYYVLTLSLGDTRSNQLNATDRLLSFDRAYTSDNSHPIVRRFNKQECVGEWHIIETLITHWPPELAAWFTKFIDPSLKVPASALSCQKDCQTFIVPHCIESVWDNFWKRLKLQTLPIDIECVTMDDENQLGQADIYSGKVRGDAKGLLWDLRLTKVCGYNYVFIMDLMPVGQLETFLKIRTTFKFMIEEPTTTKITWTTEWLSDLQETIVAELLKVKNNYIANFPTEGYVKTLSEMRRLAEPVLPNDDVQELRNKLQASHPQVTQCDGDEVKIYFRKYDAGKAYEGKLKAKGVNASVRGYHGGCRVHISKELVGSYKGKLDELYNHIVESL